MLLHYFKILLFTGLIMSSYGLIVQAEPHLLDPHVCFMKDIAKLLVVTL